MKYKHIGMRSCKSEAVMTEIMYEIASARNAGYELLRVDINKSSEEKACRKLFLAVVKVLKTMKEQGRIQFFATPKSFENFSTEAQFLTNKYPNLFETIPQETPDLIYIYIRI